MLDTSEFKGWPSGDNKPILELAFLPKDIESRYKLLFHRGKDDLDWYMGTYFIDALLGPIVMMRHESTPSDGTILYVDGDVDIDAGIKRICKVLNLERDDILWKATET